MANELLKRRSGNSLMLRRTIIAGFVLFAIISFKQATAAITNGGFEDGGRRYQLFQESRTIPGWILTYQDSTLTSTFEMMGSGASEGVEYVRIFAGPFPSMGDDSAHLTLSTDSNFSATPGSCVSFDYKVDLFPENLGQSVSAILFTTQGSLSHSFSITQNWANFSFTVPSNAQASRLEFHAKGYGYSDKQGFHGGAAELFLDNVQVIPAPEPSVIALLVFGLGGLPVIAWQRWSDRKKAKGGE